MKGLFADISTMILLAASTVTRVFNPCLIVLPNNCE